MNFYKNFFVNTVWNRIRSFSMVNLMKKFFSLFLAICVFGAVPAFAIEPHSVITTQEEHYSASSPTGYFSQYPEGAVVQTVNTGYYGGGYIPVNNNILTTTTVVPTNYETTQPMPATVQKIDTPQQYDRVVTTTQTVKDEREGIDKVLDRSFKTVGILGIAGLFAAGITAIFASL